MLPQSRLDAVLDTTWPAESTLDCGPFRLRRSAGGGQRVTAATLTGPGADAAQIDAAEARMRDWQQRPAFRLREGQTALDTALAARGYALADPTVFLATHLAPLAAQDVAPVTAFDIWPPLAIMAEIWRGGGIGPDRLAVMDRAAGPKTAILGRSGDRPAGVGFIAVDGGVAMLHALEVRAAARRKGLARHMIRHAARWAHAQGCEWLAVAVTEVNVPARALYAGLAHASRLPLPLPECAGPAR